VSARARDGTCRADQAVQSDDDLSVYQQLTPIGIVDRDGEPWVEWADLTGIVPDEPFFDQTVQRCLADPARAASRRCTPLAALPMDSPRGTADELRPTGFVFHTSRCGSTLVARMLRATGSTLVLSEPAPLADVLSRYQDRLADRTERVRAMIMALGHARAPGHRHYVVKFDAWAVFDLALIRDAFPLVPWVFLYREPADVLASQLRRPGSHVVPGFLRDVSLDDAVAMGREAYCALVLSRIAHAAGRRDDDPLARFVPYRDLPGAVAAQIAPHFGIDVSPAGRAAMADAARWDSRTPSLPFLPTPAQHSPAVLRAARTMEPAYAALEALARRAA
jgi:hypothetical protein